MALDKPWVTTRPLEDSNGNPRGNARVLADITQDAGFGKAIGLTFLQYCARPTVPADWTTLKRKPLIFFPSHSLA